MAESERKSCFELRAALDDVGITQQQLAQLCGVKQLQVWRWCEGKADVPSYVWSLLSLAAGLDIFQVIWDGPTKWKIEEHHVYRNGKSYKTLAKRFHPDVSNRDTTAEMQAINALRKK